MKPLAFGAAIFTILAAIGLPACERALTSREEPVARDVEQFAELPADQKEAIQKQFPGAVPYKEALDSLLARLNTMGISAGTLLWGQSTCVDDIINTKNKLALEIKGPFNFGGLAGLPFTGVAGLDAFAHHVPENGTGVLFVGPHIGYTGKEGWGKILRHDQHHVSSCCGALVAALTRLQHGELKTENPGRDNYQEQTLEQLAFVNRDKILSSPEPLVTLTQFTYHEAINTLSTYADRIKERHFKYAVVVGAIIINTDYMYNDYLWVDHISVLDVSKNEWIMGGKPAVVTEH